MHRSASDHNDPSGSQRYRIEVTNAPDQLRVRVLDTYRHSSLVCWEGAIVRHLIYSQALPSGYSGEGTYPCDKCLVWHLILAATAGRMMLDQLGNATNTLH